jgi:hypothetical protein
VNRPFVGDTGATPWITQYAGPTSGRCASLRLRNLGRALSRERLCPAPELFYSGHHVYSQPTDQRSAGFGLCCSALLLLWFDLLFAYKPTTYKHTCMRCVLCLCHKGAKPQAQARSVWLEVGAPSS